MKKKILSFMIVGILILFLLVGAIGNVSALSRETYDKMGFWSKLKYNFYTGSILFFTSWGEANYCATDESGYNDETGDYLGFDDETLRAGERIDCDYCSYDKCAIDIWYDDGIYLGGEPNHPIWDRLVWYREEAGEGASFSTPYVPPGYAREYWYVQVYCCPETIPTGDDWETRVYVCDGNGEWDYKGRYDKDEYCKWDTSGVDLCWCNDEDENFYVDESDYVHCRTSPRDGWCTTYLAHFRKDCVSGVEGTALYWFDNRGVRNDLIEQCSSDERCTLDGCEKTCKSKWEFCTAGQCCPGLTCYGVCLGEEGECTTGDTKCEGTIYYECENYNWVSKGEIEGKCGYTPICNTEADTNCDGIVDRSELGVYITKWLNNQITRTKLGEVIMAWVSS